jgi:hypothetical protein
MQAEGPGLIKTNLITEESVLHQGKDSAGAAKVALEFGLNDVWISEG